MMEFDFPPFRPPSEAKSYLIRIVRGCYWNRCAFCGMYKDVKFCMRKKEEILRDIDNLPRFFPPSKTAFLADSDPLVHKDIVEIVRYLNERYELERITSYTRIKTLCRMPEEKLEELREAGLKRVHVGLESGDREVLELIRKGVTPEEAVKAGRKARKHFEVTYYIITGLGGVERSEKHAKNTAKVINDAKPTFVRVRNLTILPNAPISKMVGKEITLLNAKQQLEELRLLIENINSETYLTCDHVSNYLFSKDGPIFFGVSGFLPDEKDEMLEEIELAIKNVELMEKSGEKVLTSNDMYRLGLITL